MTHCFHSETMDENLYPNMINVIFVHCIVCLNQNRFKKGQDSQGLQSILNFLKKRVKNSKKIVHKKLISLILSAI